MNRYLAAFTEALHAQVKDPTGWHRVFVKDVAGIYQFADTSFAADSGQTPEAMIGRTDDQFYPPDLVRRYRADDLRVMASGTSVCVEEPYIVDGERRIVRTSKAPVLGHNAEVVGILGIIADVTADVEAERRARQQARMLKEGERLARFGSWLYNYADDTLEVSDGFRRCFPAMGDGPEVPLADFLAHVVPDDRDRAAALFAPGHPGRTERVECRILSDAAAAPRTMILRGRTEFREEKGRPVPDFAMGAAHDVTDLRTRERDLQRLTWMMGAITDSHAAVIRARTEAALMEGVCKALTKDDVFALAWIGVPRDTPDRDIEVVASAGKASSYLDGLRVSWGDGPYGNGPSGQAVRFGRTQVVDDVGDAPLFIAWLESARAVEIASLIALPIRVGRTVDAVMAVYSTEQSAFGPQEIALLERFATDVGVGIEIRRNRRAIEEARRTSEAHAARVRQAMVQTIDALSSTLEARDPYTAGHQRRVAEMAATIAEIMGLDTFRIDGIRLAGLVHDIGKINIPLQILCTPARLTALEFELIKTHPEEGYTILKDLDLPWPIADIVRQHHEYLDGSGYPGGLRGDQILQDARILTVADILESMSSARPYRPPLGLPAALAEIKRLRGSKLDPDVVDAALSHFDPGGLETGDIRHEEGIAP